MALLFNRTNYIKLFKTRKAKLRNTKKESL